MAQWTAEQWERISAHLDRALELEGRAREGWITELERQDAELGRQLRELLEAHDANSAAAFLERSPLSRAPGAAPEAEAADYRLQMIGRQFGSYRVLSLLGHGGMGSVWLAERVDGLFTRRVALKLIHPALVSQLMTERFTREREILASLNHPNIARLIDAGFAEDGQPYLALEYVAGTPLTSYCDDHHLLIRQRLELFRQILSAVQYAHAHLVIHRDLKPSNIVVTENGQIYLLDFGIAKLLTEGEATETELTRLGGRALTPDYAAPEQISGAPITTAADVYALGVMLYELLIGERPYKLKRETRGALEEAILQVDPLPPSRATITERAATARGATGKKLAKALKGDVDTIVIKALKKSTTERYATANAFDEDIARFLRGDVVLAQRDSFGYRAVKFARRYRGAVAATAAVALVLMIATLFAVLQMREAQAQRDQARFQEKRAEAESQFMTLMMSTLGSGQRPVTPAQILDNGVALLDKQYRGDPEFRATMLLRMASRFMDLGDVPREHAVLVKAEAIVKQNSDYSQIAQVECNLVETEIDLGHAERAPVRLAAGLSALSHEANPKPTARVECLYADALIDEANGKLPVAIGKAEDAVALLERAGETRGLQYSDLLSLVAALYQENGDFKKAFEYHQRDGIALEHSGQDQTVSGVSVLHNVAADLMSFGEIREALAREQDVVARWRANSIDGSVRPELLNVYGNLQLRMGQAEAATDSYQESIREAHREQDLESELFARAGLASALLASGQLDAAKAQLTELFPLTLGHETEHRRSLARARIANAELLLARGQPDEARVHIDATLQMLRTGAIAGSYLGFALLKSSRIGIATGRFEDAERCATEALALFERRALKPELSADVGEALLLTAEARRGRGDNIGAHAAASVAARALIAGLGPEHALAREALAMR